jgi:trehalose-6-phosphate synthase
MLTLCKTYYKMETIRIEILNPKAKSILKGLADLNLISMKKEKKQSEFMDLLTKLRANSDTAPSLDEITKEVESVRSKRYEN